MIRTALVGTLLLVGCQYNRTEEDRENAKAEMAENGSRSEARESTAVELPDRPMAEEYVRPGFAVYEQDGRLWVFKPGSEGQAEFLAEGAPEKRITLVGAGPDRKTLLGVQRETLDDYVVLTRYGREGFKVVPAEGRLWVFREGTKDYADFLAKGEPEKRITLVGAGPNRKTLLGTDRDTLDDYIAATRYGAPGFRVFADEGRLWVFRDGSEGLQEYLEKGAPEKRITLIGAGPDRKTLLGTDREALDAYLAALQGNP